MLETMTQILLVGTELPLLEGLAQSFAALGFAPIVAQSLHEAREAAAHTSAAHRRREPRAGRRVERGDAEHSACAGRRVRALSIRRRRRS